MNPYAPAFQAEIRKMLPLQYQMGGRGPTVKHPNAGIDCRGFFERMFEKAGAGPAIGGRHADVRGEHRWAVAHGCWREADATPEKFWGIIYAEDTGRPEPRNPLHIRHVAPFLQPVSKRWPKGRAVSALNPTQDVQYHGLKLGGTSKFGGPFKILGYIEPDYSLIDAESDPISDPEPPVPTQEVVA